MKCRLLWSFVAVVALAASHAVGGISGGAYQRSSNSELLLLGPVELVKERQGVIVVLGQKLQLPSVNQFEVGQTVAVYGSVRADGTYAISAVQRHGLYVPGASPIVLTGVVQKVSSAIGRVIVNGISVDINSVSGADVSAGAVVQIAGTQPSNAGLILAQGISGGAVQGISGGAVQGISGGAVQGISGGAVQGISGGAVQGISGGAVQGISGGAVQGISGGAVQGISGGAVQGISGGAVQGISGGALH